METIIAAVVFVLLAAGALSVVLYIKNNALMRVNLVEYEWVAVFRDTGEFVEIRGPGEVRIRQRTLFVRQGEQIRGQSGQVVVNLSEADSKFDLREIAVSLRDEHCISSDSAVVNITPGVVYQITDPAKLVLNIQNHSAALNYGH
jgi:regulator of protease activity HflC (stomatin/prohibitin superfamily)